MTLNILSQPTYSKELIFYGVLFHISTTSDIAICYCYLFSICSRNLQLNQTLNTLSYSEKQTIIVQNSSRIEIIKNENIFHRSRRDFPFTMNKKYQASLVNFYRLLEFKMLVSKPHTLYAFI